VSNEQEKSRGRPPALSPDVQEEIIGLLRQGKGNREACRMAGVGVDALYYAISTMADFAERYRDAKQAAVDALVDRASEVNEMALGAETGAAVAAHKHLADALRWEAARRAPQKWGEKASIEVTGKVDMDDPAELAKRLAFLEALKGGSSEEDED